MTNHVNGRRIIDEILDDGSWMRICGCFSRRHLSLNTFSLIRRILCVITNGRPAVASHAWAACSLHAWKERAGSGQQTGRSSSSSSSSSCSCCSHTSVSVKVFFFHEFVLVRSRLFLANWWQLIIKRVIDNSSCVKF